MSDSNHQGLRVVGAEIGKLMVAEGLGATILPDFSVRDGLMHSRALAFDTNDTLVIGEGDISLKQEKLDLLLRPRPKDISILALRSVLTTPPPARAPGCARRWPAAR